MRDTPGTYLLGARQMDLTARELATDVEISTLSNHYNDAPARAKGPNAPRGRQRELGTLRSHVSDYSAGIYENRGAEDGG